MNGLTLARAASATVPELVAAAGERAGMRFLEFFAANGSNRTRGVPMTAPPMNS
jgi:hypothetical protein